jgi:hypothetical protein
MGGFQLDDDEVDGEPSAAMEASALRWITDLLHSAAAVGQHCSSLLDDERAVRESVAMLSMPDMPLRSLERCDREQKNVDRSENWRTSGEK